MNYQIFTLKNFFGEYFSGYTEVHIRTFGLQQKKIKVHIRTFGLQRKKTKVRICTFGPQRQKIKVRICTFSLERVKLAFTKLGFANFDDNARQTNFLLMSLDINCDHFAKFLK